MYRNEGSIPIYIQESTFLKKYTQFYRKKYVREKQIIIEGFLKPSDMSKEYRIKIDYEFKIRPSITLPDEDFSQNRPPHTFKDGELCLYHKDGIGAWSSKISLVELAPMIAHWLWCYELWQVTDVWFGEEFPHESGEEKVAS